MQKAVVSHIVRLPLAGDSILVEVVHGGDKKESNDNPDKSESLVQSEDNVAFLHRASLEKTSHLCDQTIKKATHCSRAEIKYQQKNDN